MLAVQQAIIMDVCWSLHGLHPLRPPSPTQPTPTQPRNIAFVTDADVP